MLLVTTSEINHNISGTFFVKRVPYWERHGFSEIAAVAANLYTGWGLFEFGPVLRFEEPSHVSSNSSFLAYIAAFQEISSGLLKLAEDVQ